MKAKILNKFKKGLSLMEVVVAIAISMISMTVTSIYTTQLMIAAQQNFFESSSNEYESMVIEQLRLVESNLQEAKSKAELGLISTLNGLPLNITPQTNDTFCGNPDLDLAQGQLFLTMSLPDFFPATPTPTTVAPTSFQIQLSTLPGTGTFEIINANEEGVTYKFVRISDSQKTGAMRTSGYQNIGIAMTRIVEKGSSGTGDFIVIKVRFAYQIPGQSSYRFTKVTDVRMLRDFIC